MFAKPYKLKSSNTLKNSEKKHLIQRILDEYPNCTEEKVKEIVSLKSVTSCMKLVLYSNETVNVYAVDGVPMLLELSERLVPTVCALWRVPDLVPTVTISSQVLSKVCGGAPLFAPGVCGGVHGANWAVNAVLAARTPENRAAALIGRAAMSSGDLLYKSSGVCLECIHFYRDQLCRDVKFNKIERPEMGPGSLEDEALLTGVQQLSIQQPMKEEWPSLGKPPAAADSAARFVPALIADPPVDPPADPLPHTDVTEESIDSTLDNSIDKDGNIPTDMDGLLRWCLLTFIKVEGKSVELPLKTNLLYKNHMIPLCPPDRTLDVKKSSYKKMGKFLDAMQKEGLICVREIERGVDALVSLQPLHPLVRAHVAPRAAALAALAAPAPADDAPDYDPPQVRELYCVTAAVSQLFAPIRKGTALSGAEVRGAVTAAVRARGLAGGAGRLRVDAALAALVDKREQDYITWEELMNKVLNKMTPSTEMKFADGSVKLIKSRLEPIKMQTVNRSGNKKVTLVSNLEAYGFQLAALAGAWQRAAAAACGVTRSAAARADQLMLQGDQTHFVAKTLIEKYGLPKKFLEDADKALNKKK